MCTLSILVYKKKLIDNIMSGILIHAIKIPKLAFVNEMEIQLFK